MGCGGSTEAKNTSIYDTADTFSKPFYQPPDGETNNGSLQLKPQDTVPHSTASVIEGLVPNTAIGDMLANVPLLLKLKESERDKLGGVMVQGVFGDGTNVFAQGDVGDKFYIVMSGDAVVTKTSENGEQSQIGSLSTGDYFGEAALLGKDNQRGATITAKGTLTTLWLSNEKFRTLLGGDAFNIKFVSRRGISAEKGGPTITGGRPVGKSKPADADTSKSEEQKELCRKGLQGTVLCSSFDSLTIDAIVDEMWMENVVIGTSLMKQGDLGVMLYVIEEGHFGIFVAEDENEPIEVQVDGPGRCFGELALMYNAPRAATVTAKTDAKVHHAQRTTQNTEHYLMNSKIAGVCDRSLHVPPFGQGCRKGED
jgi:CRP-like cAMP-binding protein